MTKKIFFKWSFVPIITIIALAFIIVSCGKKDEVKTEQTEEQKFHIITSTVEGGNWSDPKTWIEGVVPDEFTDVNITGKVTLADTANCLNLMVDVGANLVIEKSGILKIKHHAINEGTIINNGIILLNDEKK